MIDPRLDDASGRRGLLEGQHVVVLGGTSGIGLATAKAALAAGARVTVAGRDRARLTAALDELQGRGQGFCLDATDRTALDAFFGGTIGGFDHLVLSVATGGGAGLFRDLDLAVLQRAIEGKVIAFFQALQAALPTIRTDGSVTMVTAGSARGAGRGTAGLAANNGALNASIAPLAVELAPLRVNAICPGLVQTPIFDNWPEEVRERVFARIRTTPVGRVGQPAEIAAGILFLITNSFVTGTVLDVDGGIRFAS